MNYKTYFFDRFNVRISKKDVEIIVEEIFEYPQSLSALIEVLVQGNEQQSVLASWVLTHAVDRDNSLLEPYVADVVQFLCYTKSNGAKRSCLRALESTKINDDSKGVLIDLCFKFMLSSSDPIAVKAFSMTVIYNCAINETEVLRELQLVLEEKMLFESTGFNSRAKKIIKRINNK